MKNRQLTLACVFIFILLGVSVVFSQEQTVSAGSDQPASAPAEQPDNTPEAAPATQPAERPAVTQEAKTSPQATTATRTQAAKPAPVADKAAKREQPAVAKETVNPPAGSGLLDVSDEEYKTARIPGMPAVKKADLGQQEVIEETVDDTSAGIDTEKDKKGFLGMSKETADTIMIVVFFLLIAVIFILYRARSKGGSRRVTRSYLKR